MIPQINLLPRDIGAKNQARLMWYSFSGVALLFLLSVGLIYFLSVRTAGGLAEEYDVLQGDVATLEAEIQEMRAALVNHREDAVMILEEVLYPMTPLVKEVHNVLPENGYIDSFQWGEKTVSFSAQVDDKLSVARLTHALKSSPFFEKVHLSNLSGSGLLYKQERLEKEPINTVERFVATYELEVSSDYLAEEYSKHTKSLNEQALIEQKAEGLAKKGADD